VKSSKRSLRMKVTSDGAGVVSHAGTRLLREMATSTGLVERWDEVLLDIYKAAPTRHMPGQVLVDLAVAIADGARSISDLASRRDQPCLFGPVASTATAWRALDRVSEGHLALLREGRAAARATAWEAGAAPDLSGELYLDFDATIVVAHSDKELATPSWKKTYGFHPLLSAWPARSRLIVRKERPHPGAQLSIFDDDQGMRHAAFLTDTAPGVVPGQIAGLELRHRQHARVEDRIRQAKATGLRNLPCRAAAENNAWLEVLLAAADLVAWTRLICFADEVCIARTIREQAAWLPTSAISSCRPARSFTGSSASPHRAMDDIGDPVKEGG
jgi:hypothetical protein